MKIQASGQACGAVVTGIDLSKPLSDQTVSDIRAGWMAHKVLSFPGQSLSDDELERFTLYFGPFGDDPFIAPIDGRKNVIAIHRHADETTPIFADSWHTDWSFQQRPPAGTVLYGLTIPPHGGDTLFANQQAAFETMPDELRAKIEGKKAIHSAKLVYAPSGMYGQEDKSAGRAMTITPSDEANDTYARPIIRTHPETGKPCLYGTLGYVIGIEGMEQNEAISLLYELQQWQTKDAFIYRHQWAKGTLVMWDNRAVLHKATGGYEGYERKLHRTTIGASS